MTVSAELPHWAVDAANLPEHARNPIHTDEGGRAAGFPGALVAGVTVYAYLTRPAAEGWGLDWVERGTAEVRFVSPVFAGDRVECVSSPTEDGRQLIEAVVAGDTRASCRVGLPAGPPPAHVPGNEVMEPLTVSLVGEWSDYGLRAGEDLDLYRTHGIAHPALWPALANNIVHRQLAQGSWIHTRSAIRHLRSVPDGSEVLVEATVTDRFETRAGERAVLDVRIGLDGEAVAIIEHEALIKLKS